MGSGIPELGKGVPESVRRGAGPGPPNSKGWRERVPAVQSAALKAGSPKLVPLELSLPACKMGTLGPMLPLSFTS